MLYLGFILGCWVGCIGGVCLIGFTPKAAAKNLPVAIPRVISLFFLFLTLPLWVVIAAWLKVSSPGPVYHPRPETIAEPTTFSETTPNAENRLNADPPHA
jgi:hypothetical protein